LQDQFSSRRLGLFLILPFAIAGFASLAYSATAAGFETDR